MKCIVCDRCGTIIEDHRRCRVVTCAKPLKPDIIYRPGYKGNDKQANDILWSKELCSECAEAFECFVETPSEPVTPPEADDGDDGEQDSDDREDGVPIV